jgi:hypothetical protein
MDSKPRFPLYIPSKGRAEFMMTSKCLTEMGVHHYVIVEPQEVEAYREASKGLTAEILELDLGFKERYELCDDLGLTKSTGPGPARNFAWEHSIKNGHKWHWVMDDNIRRFLRYNHNIKIPTNSASFWVAMEDFVLRYKNVAMAGPNYYMFVPRKVKMPPFVINTRIYSCNLIRNDLPFRWRGRYNEDTILSLDMLKANYSTIQFNVFLQNKLPTQTIGGGNTQEFYHAEGVKVDGEKYARGGTYLKSKMLVDVHPDCSELVWKFKRWHHTVDYKRFKHNIPIKRDDIELSTETNNYGMVLHIYE